MRRTFQFLEGVMTEFLSKMPDLISFVVAQFHPHNDERCVNDHFDKLTAEIGSLRKAIDGLEKRLHTLKQNIRLFTPGSHPLSLKGLLHIWRKWM
jgi:hypothetical protein